VTCDILVVVVFYWGKGKGRCGGRQRSLCAWRGEYVVCGHLITTTFFISHQTFRYHHTLLSIYQIHIHTFAPNSFSYSILVLPNSSPPFSPKAPSTHYTPPPHAPKNISLRPAPCAQAHQTFMSIKRYSSNPCTTYVCTSQMSMLARCGVA
jgi:hypothetical protein